jgi:hypothetical protein
MDQYEIFTNNFDGFNPDREPVKEPSNATSPHPPKAALDPHHPAP